MQSTAILAWVYALLMAVGGVIGYIKSHSKASLLSGTGFGLILLFSGYGMWQGSRQSLIATTVCAASLSVIFAIRVLKTRRFIPAGVLAVLSLVTFLAFMSKLAQN
jgi:uncharacterized membrane protein (UPF0136 family)